jgi:hypothetical protein
MGTLVRAKKYHGMADLGLWHGFVFPFAWIGSLFDPQIAVYAVPNNGGWYDFGFFLGITVLGGGTHFSSKKRNRS